MDYKKHSIYHGFKLTEIEEISEINCTCYYFIHEKSGAKLLKLLCDDDNKTFSISFRTPPKDSTGVAHILEHSVLCGSRKFPVKDPFIELAKGSLNTFLNAMTFSDKTMYPVASRNKKDFFNLMDVYMDAVLYPNIYKFPQILMQEGWHYEIEKPEDELSIKGVVYNEMKGAYSSPETVLFQNINKSLFKDTTYSAESGGDPDVIPSLTLEQFLSFHNKYYHPSNSYIFIYGDGNIDEELGFLDDNYLKDFTNKEIDSEIKIQKETGSLIEKCCSYPIANDESPKDKTYHSLNFVAGDTSDAKLSLGFEILEYMLLETPSAPLRKALLASGLGKDVFGMYDSQKLQPTFSVVLKNSNYESKEAFKNLVFENLKKLSMEGIDKEVVEAAVNIKEFSLKEGEYEGYPKGLVYNIKAMDSWLYDENPYIHLKFLDIINSIKNEGINGRYFEDLIDKYLLKSSHSSLVSAVPEANLADKKDKELKEKLCKYKASLSQDEIKVLCQNTEELKKRQAEPETPEDLMTIPLLKLSDMDRKVDFTKTKVLKDNGITYLYHPIFTSGIAYINLYLDSTEVAKDDIPYLALLTASLGIIDTKNYSYDSLTNLININTGGIRFSVEPISSSDDDSIYTPRLSIKSKVVMEKLPKLTHILKEILFNTEFKNHGRLKELIGELRSRLEMKILERGHLVSAFRALSYLSPSADFTEKTSGLSFYEFVRKLDENFDEEKEKTSQKLKEILTLLTKTKGLIISATSKSENEESITKELKDFSKDFTLELEGNKKYDFIVQKKNEGLMTASKIQYVSKAANFKNLGYKYSGSMLVLKTICSLQYLWNNVRVLGGAYGCFMSIQRNGNMFLSSYRDPNLKETLNVYDNMSEFVGNLDIDDREMTKYIIGTISDLDYPLTPAMKGERGDLYFIKNYTEEMLLKERMEVLETTVSKIREFKDLVYKATHEDYVCVLGNEEKIKSCSDVFTNTISIFK